MNILLASAHPYIPQMIGGAQSSMHDLATEFARRGHKVGVLSGLTGEGWVGRKSRVRLKLGRRNYVIDTSLGYPVYRAWFPWKVATDVARHMRADVVVPQSWYPVRIARALDGEPARIVIYLRNVEVEDLGGDPGDLRDVTYVANSQFTADRFNSLFGIRSTVVYPLTGARCTKPGPHVRT